MNKYVAFFLLAIGVLTTGSVIALDTYTGTCDASAVTLLDSNRFIVANDEDDQLHIYDFKTESPRSSVELDEFLKHPESEADLEGVARIGDNLIWIGSHGRNKKGKSRPARNVLFTTGASGKPQGTPYRKLAEDLSNHPKLAELNLQDVIQLDKKEQFELASKKSGLNIEGLAATPKGELLIGLRNPLSTDKRAILVPMINPMEVLNEGEKPEFAEPILLDLDGLGIRAIEYVSGTQSGRQAAYYILAGPKGKKGKVFLYRWSGKPGEEAEAPTKLQSFDERAAEGLALGPNGKRLFIVFDDGRKKINGKKCKKLDNQVDKKFGTTWVPLDGN